MTYDDIIDAIQSDYVGEEAAIQYTDAKIQRAIKDTEIEMARIINGAALPKLLSPPITLTSRISSNILTLPDDFHAFYLLWHDDGTNENHFILRTKEWRKLQDGYAVTDEDQYCYAYGERKLKLVHSFTALSAYMQYVKKPQVVYGYFNYGTAQTEFEGMEDILKAGVAGQILAGEDEESKGTYYLKLYRDKIAAINATWEGVSYHGG